jgi:predicted RNA-binding protein with TRAM domain
MARKNTDKVVFHQIKVLDAGAKGVSVAKAPDGKVIFIPNVVPGDVVDVQTFKKRKAFYEGKAVKFHEFSEHRIEPICEHFGVCGGCKWQNMKYSQQLFYKQNEVKNHLQRIGKIELPEFELILGSEKQLKILVSLFNSNIGLISKVNSDLEIYNVVLEKVKEVTVEEIKFGLQQSKAMLGNVYQFDIANHLFSEIDGINKTNDKKVMIKKINKIIEKLNFIVQKYTRIWLKEHQAILNILK